MLLATEPQDEPHVALEPEPEPLEPEPQPVEEMLEEGEDVAHGDITTDSIMSPQEGSAAEDKKEDSPRQRRKRKGIPSKVSMSYYRVQYKMEQKDM